jgi:hypothetical protein
MAEHRATGGGNGGAAGGESEDASRAAAVADAAAAVKAMSLAVSESVDAHKGDADVGATEASESEGEEPGAGGAAQPVRGSSTTLPRPWFELAAPTGYVYESEYAHSGAEAVQGVWDEKEKPELVNRWTNAPARLFKLRGPGYLAEETTNNVALKVASKDAAFACVGVQVFQAGSSMEHASSKVRALRDFLDAQRELDKGTRGAPSGDAPMYLVFCWNFSNFFRTEFTTVIKVFRRAMHIDSKEDGPDPALDRALSRWIRLPADKKNEKLKYAASFRECSPQHKSAIEMLGGERPVILGRKLTTTYFSGPGYLEICSDVGSSTVAAMLNSLMLKTSGAVVLDECLCIEAQREDELPERALFTSRFSHCSVEGCVQKLDDLFNLI